MASLPLQSGNAEPPPPRASAWPAGIRPKLLFMVVACLAIEFCFVDFSIVSWGGAGLVVGDLETRLLAASSPPYADPLVESRTFSAFHLIEDEDAYMLHRLAVKSAALAAEEAQQEEEAGSTDEGDDGAADDQQDEEAVEEQEEEEEVVVGGVGTGTEDFLSSLPDLLPALVRPGWVDLDRYAADQAGLVQPEVETLSRREGPVIIITAQNSANLSFVTMGCPDSQDRPDMRCQVPCQDDGCTNAVKLCESIPICTHVDRYRVTRRDFVGILHHALSSQDLARRAARHDAEAKDRMHQQCRMLGQAVLQSDTLEPQLRVWDAEKRATEERFRNGTGAMVLLHIQKSAGTTMCEWAKEEGLRIPPDGRVKTDVGKINGKNCNPNTPDSHRIWKGQPEEQVEWVQSSGVKFIGNEMFMARRLAWGAEISYLTVLRHPFDRLLSHYKSFQPECIDRDRRRRYVPSSFQEWIMCSEDNVMTRRLCDMVFDGDEPLDEGVLLCAKNRLARFNLVLTVETFDLGKDMLRRKFGWTTAAPRKGSRHGASFESTISLNATELAVLRERHKYDLELYAFAQGLSCRSIALLEQEEPLPVLPTANSTQPGDVASSA